jgi:branched-chain amino acid transport system ATP-binding protein
MLEFNGVNTYYGELHVLKDVNYEIKKGEIVCLLGGNASGKSTTMKAVLGIVRPKTGNILFEGQPINALPTAERVQRGIAPVPEARRLFPRMTVLENLELGAYTRRDRENLSEDLERVYALFPPPCEGTTSAAGRYSLRRRAADGRHRAGPDGATAPALHGRAFHGAIARLGRFGIRNHPDHQ